MAIERPTVEIYQSIAPYGRNPLQCLWKLGKIGRGGNPPIRSPKMKVVPAMKRTSKV